MYPDLISIGPLTIHTYGLFVALGFASAIYVIIRLGKREGVPPQQIMDMAFIGIVWAIIGSRLFYVLLNLGYYRQNPLDILKLWQGGLVFSGGLIVALAALAWHMRRRRMPVLATADLFAPGLALGQAIGRIGCFFAGCCYGRPADIPWAVVFTDPQCLAPLHLPLHPTQAYAALGGFLLFGILLFVMKKRTFPGQVFIWYLILHSTFRLLVERFRGDHRGLIPGTEMSTTQLLSLVVLIGSVVALYVIKPKGSDRQGPRSDSE
ncbi:MAG: prolipoprotein diacylglyceryl transferase [Deltaproteobacteria bacterium]|nr:prolipoprotein diacylglyceryl transferase [Deltaproteobacteria bacterium]